MADRINPQQISWQAPTENTDGSPITQELAYQLDVDGQAFATFPGFLNPDGSYSQQVADITGLQPNVEYTLALRAFYTAQPALISDPSNTLTIVVGVARPNPPAAFDAS